MGGKFVKLISINVKKLYGCYDYHVNFNSDVTFIYGLNGCGKTTILNITEAIITGQLFKLFNYQFSDITLQYAKSSIPNEAKEISILSNKQELSITFEKSTYSIELVELEEGIRQAKNLNYISRIYFNRYNFLVEIRDTFNYVYLPLSRSYVTYEDVDEISPYTARLHNRHLLNDDYTGIDNRDGAMLKIETLIYQRYSKANSAINRINDMFRNNMLKPLIELNGTYNFANFINEITNKDVNTALIYKDIKRIETYKFSRRG